MKLVDRLIADGILPELAPADDTIDEPLDETIDEPFDDDIFDVDETIDETPPAPGPLRLRAQTWGPVHRHPSFRGGER